MDLPTTYKDLSEEELLLLLSFNQKKQKDISDIYEKIRLQQKIDYIKSVLNEMNK